MSAQLHIEEVPRAARDHRVALTELSRLPDRCAVDLAEVATRIGADKLELIQWMRADIAVARLLASKLTL